VLVTSSIMSSFAYINSIYFMDSTKTHTVVPEQNSKLNIYVYIHNSSSDVSTGTRLVNVPLVFV
jgi:hypothetical protein